MNKLTASAFAFAVVLASHAAYAKGDWKEEFTKADTNGDGKLSQAEFTAAGTEKFDKLDANGDGFVTLDEKKAHYEAKHGSKVTGSEDHPSATQKLNPDNTTPADAKK